MLKFAAYFSPIGDYLRQSWPLWSGVLVLLLTLGVLKINFIEINIPPEYNPYIILGLPLIWSWIINFGLLSWAKKQSTPFPPYNIEGDYINCVMAHIDYRRSNRFDNKI